METIKSPQFWICLAGMICTTLLAALKVIGGEAAVGLLGGIVFGVGASAVGKAGATVVKRVGPMILVFAAALGIAVGAGGCGLDWGKVLSTAGVVLSTAGKAATAAQGVIAVSCDVVREYGSADDYTRCQQAMAGAQAAASLAAATGKLLPSASAAPGVTAVLPSVEVNGSTIPVAYVVPVAQVAQVCRSSPTVSGPVAPAGIGFTKPGQQATDSKPVEVR